MRGDRPTKPHNASDLGFSDLLWDFLQLCWDRDRSRRPAAGEVVGRLGEAAANWNTLMPPVDSKSGPVKVEPDPIARQETPPREPKNPPPGRSREDAGEHTERLLAGMASESNDFPSGIGESRV